MSFQYSVTCFSVGMGSSVKNSIVVGIDAAQPRIAAVDVVSGVRLAGCPGSIYVNDREHCTLKRLPLGCKVSSLLLLKMVKFCTQKKLCFEYPFLRQTYNEEK